MEFTYIPWTHQRLPHNTDAVDKRLNFDFKFTPGQSLRRGAAWTPPMTLYSLGISVQQWENLESTTSSTLPRFLFRGFHAGSGGGYAGLNNETGIIPLAFLRSIQVATSMYGASNLRGNIDGHLCGSRGIKTYFSSWTADFKIAQGYATNNGYIAILDTTLLTDSVSIYYTPDLLKAGLTSYSFPEEYIAYGRITGAGYHCVRISAIQGDMGELLPHSSSSRGYTPTTGQQLITEHHVLAAVRIAKHFRKPNDSRPDVVLYVTAMMLMMSNSKKGANHPQVARLMRYHLRRELRQYCKPASGERPQGLVNPMTSTYGQVLLGQTLTLLTEVGRQIRIEGF